MKKFYYTLLIPFMTFSQVFMFSCNKDETPEPITPPPPPVVVEENFIERYEGKYLFVEEEYRYVIEFKNGFYYLHLQNNEFREDLDCWNYSNRVVDDPNYSVVSLTPNEYKYRIDSGDDGYRIQTITKVDGGIQRDRKFFESNGDEKIDERAVQTLTDFHEVIEICDFDADYLSDPNYVGLDFNTPDPFYTAFTRDYMDAGLDPSKLPNSISIVILEDDVYDADSSARAGICDAGLDVEIKRSWWDNSTLPGKFNTMYHEFGHGVFDYAHTCDARDIMHTRSEEFLEECGEDIILSESIHTSPVYYTGFKAAVDRLMSGEKQIKYGCSQFKGSKIIHD